MPTDVTLVLTPRQASNETFLKDQAIRSLGLKASDVGAVHITRKSIDARRGKV
ncbi:MAG TPA: FAD-binding protein, partial [Bacteroidales bacterium]|nr:FAD-binding protein [Bacteroidales bacterium]